MAEKRHLITGNDPHTQNGKTDYGSIPYRRLAQDEDEDLIQVRFVFRKQDAIVVSVLSVLVTVAIMTTLLVGIPNIRRKNEAWDLGNSTALPATSSPGKLKAAAQGSWVEPRSYPPVSVQGTYSKAAVSTNCPECSQIAADILEQNGSAVDAAIAATVCLSVADPHHTGLGGGFFMTVYNRESKTVRIIDARETAPALATLNMYHGNAALSSKGGLSVGIPSLVKGLWVAHQSYGKMKWPDLIVPSISLCKNGVSVSQSLSESLQQNRRNILVEENMRSVFTNRWTRDVLKHGDLLKQPTLGDTLRILAEKGGDELYFGQLAQNLTNDIQSFGGIITLDDLRNYTVLIKEPVSISLPKGRKLFSVPPPGSGSLVAFFLNVMSGYNLNRMSLNESDRAILTYHRMIEAFKFAYAKRTALGDPDFVDVTQLMANLTSQEYANHIRSLIKDNETFSPEYYDADVYQPVDHGTSHVSIIAPNGDSVVMTSTINQRFGAGFMSKSTGIILNDEMDDFSSPNVTNYFMVPPSPANFISPGKRPLSSMCPSIIVDDNGDVILGTGAAGGSMITSSTAYVILRRLFFEETLQMATDAPRIHHQLFPNNAVIESGMPAVVIRGLKEIGHSVSLTEKIGTVVNSIGQHFHNDDLLVAVGDRRVAGGIAGF